MPAKATLGTSYQIDKGISVNEIIPDIETGAIESKLKLKEHV